MRHQAFNPYLPLYEHIPDGEPRFFEGRVYIYGSHDRANGTFFCQEDYVAWSAPADDLGDWRCEGVIYRRGQDPADPEGKLELFAPDVVRGPDGRYYLYYCLKMYQRISVAAADGPAGPFRFYGYVSYADGRPLTEHMPYDPAVLHDDDGQIYLYYGFSSPVLSARYGVPISPGAMMTRLAPDMLTALSAPRPLIPCSGAAKGTDFEGHAYFEAPSIRKLQGRYYLVYSSEHFHELCYALSDRPDGPFCYGGVVVDNGGLGYRGRSFPVAVTGNNHGGLLDVNGRTYIFYHRHTNGNSYARQGCAEEVSVGPDGRIPQAELTSQGLNGGPLKAAGSVSAAICCELYGPWAAAFLTHDTGYDRDAIAYITQAGVGETAQVYIANMTDGTFAGYRYFDFAGPCRLDLSVRGRFDGSLALYLDDPSGEPLVCAPVRVSGDGWRDIALPLNASGVHALYIAVRGEGSLCLERLTFHPVC